MIEITYESVRCAAWDILKAQCSALVPMLKSLSDEEILKIPSILEKPDVKRTAELYGYCDCIIRKGYYFNVYIIGGAIFKGETIAYTESHTYNGFFKL